MSYQSLEDAMLHEAMNGQTPITAHDIAVLNPSESLPVGVGAGNDQPFFSGSSQNIRTTWVEQGWGHDSQRWPAYPFSVGDNPARVHSRRSSIPEAQRENFAIDAYALAEGHEAERQGIWARMRRSGAAAHGAIIDIPDAVPYTQTVPTYSGGAVAHPGVDIPLSMLYGA